VFADWILKGIDLDSGRISANWREIDDALMRSKYVVINAVLHDQLIDRLKSNGDVVSSIQGLPYKPTRARVEFGLRAVIPNLVAGPLGAGPLTGNPFPDTWPIVGIDWVRSRMQQFRTTPFPVCAFITLCCSPPISTTASFPRPHWRSTNWGNSADRSLRYADRWFTLLSEFHQTEFSTFGRGCRAARAA
jgi:hypothetical protein